MLVDNKSTPRQTAGWLSIERGETMRLLLVIPARRTSAIVGCGDDHFFHALNMLANISYLVDSSLN